jgi:hypothetical protein
MVQAINARKRRVLQRSGILVRWVEKPFVGAWFTGFGRSTSPLYLLLDDVYPPPLNFIGLTGSTPATHAGRRICTINVVLDLPGVPVST